MSWTLVASGRGVDSVTINSTGANFLIASFTGYFPSASGWDNKGNTWIKLSEHIVSTYRVTLAYCINPSSVGASHTLTDPLAGGQDADIHFYAFTAPGTVTYQGETGADDNFNGGNSTKSAGYAGSMSVTPLSNDALIVAAAANYPGTSATTSAYGVDSGFTLGLSRGVTAGEYGGASAYLNQATAAAVDPTISWTTSGGGVARWVSAIAVFTVSGSGINGTLSSTLGDVTLAATGTVDIAGTTSATLANVTLASTATLDLAAQLSSTLADATLAATGTLAIAGTTSATLADVTLAAAGALDIAGTAAPTLDDVTLAATGTVTSGVTGTLAAALENVTLASAATLDLAGQLASALGNVTLAATGALDIVGTAAPTLADVTLAATGTLTSGPTATLGATLDDVTLSATGTVDILGTLGVTLDNVILVSAGGRPISGVLDVTLANVTVQASGFSGTLALSFDSVRRVARGSSIVRQVQSTAARSTTGQ